jgi:hypothetical protein
MAWKGQNTPFWRGIGHDETCASAPTNAFGVAQDGNAPSGARQVWPSIVPNEISARAPRGSPDVPDSEVVSRVTHFRMVQARLVGL